MLNEDHYGLDKVKDRILEYLAVQQRVDKVKAPILCLVGPPGVGKTSLGQSVARATGRKFVRMALGGVRDEAEIRGHRRTYIGSMPGKVLQSLTKVGTRNPLFLLDEIDKLGMDFRGDPSSARCWRCSTRSRTTPSATTTSRSTSTCRDVMFVATSNSMNIPPALLDRMEVIRLSGYTEDEKVNIALRYLLPKQMKNNGVKDDELDVTEARCAASSATTRAKPACARSSARSPRSAARSSRACSSRSTERQGRRRPRRTSTTSSACASSTYGRAEKQNQVGQVVGLAWTEVGGDLLTIEAAVMPGKGNIIRTGSLGDVMKESVEAARSVVRSRARRLGIKDEMFEKRDIHIHVPDGATPKDGPSAGVAMTTAFVSALTGIPVRADVAMTGEITLRGEVTAIGGLKEKLLAAHRGGIKTVLIPEENVKDLQEIPENVKNQPRDRAGASGSTRCWRSRSSVVPQPLPEEEPAKAAATSAPPAAAPRRCASPRCDRRGAAYERAACEAAIIAPLTIRKASNTRE